MIAPEMLYGIAPEMLYGVRRFVREPLVFTIRTEKVKWWKANRQFGKYHHTCSCDLVPLRGANGVYISGVGVTNDERDPSRATCNDLMNRYREIWEEQRKQ